MVPCNSSASKSSCASTQFAHSRQPLLTTLQAGRAIAATLVAFYHASLYIFPLNKYWGHDPARHFFDFGHSGVEFFFVLSGFIIFHIHREDTGKPSRFFRYVLKRFFRIYPIYWIVLAAVIPVYFVAPSFGQPFHREAGTILSSILLVHVNGNSNTMLTEAWTLYHEILFYCLFSLVILHRKLGMVVIALWVVASGSTLWIAPPDYVTGFLFSPLHLLFGMGLASCWMIHRGRIPAPSIMCLTGTALFIAAGMEEDYVFWLDNMTRNLIYGFSSTMIVLGVVELERQGHLRVPRPLLLIGNASYVVYLMNFTVLSLMAKIFVFCGARTALPPLVSYMLLVVLSVVLGILFHVLVERRVQRFLKWRRQNAPLTAEAEMAPAVAPANAFEHG